MKSLTLTGLFGVLTLVLVAAAYPPASTEAHRGDCPGKVICPLTGQEVCKDKCPLTATAEKTDATRADCPGQIECPLTGELVCRDKCPANATASTSSTRETEEAELPECCRNKKK